VKYIWKKKRNNLIFGALGQAIKKARDEKGWSRNGLTEMLGITPRYVVDIENEGQPSSLQVLYELVTLLDVSVDEYFFPNKKAEKDTQRRQLDRLLNDMNRRNLTIMTATAKGIKEAKGED